MDERMSKFSQEWKCPVCGKTTTIDARELREIGDPYCGSEQCEGKDVELEPVEEKEES